jgi:acyl-CoA synthetase (AMP-forming)/AMP-acid ligase II
MSETLHLLWKLTVDRDPNALALLECQGGRRWTRAELAASAADWKMRLGPVTDLRNRYVVLGEPNGERWMSAFIGLISAGAVPALLDPSEPPEAREAIARRIGAAWVWTGERLVAVSAPRRARSADYCLAKITSGTSGAPRALSFTHAQMAADGMQICSTMGIRATDVNLAVIPFGHSYGLGNLVVPLLLQGTAIACGSGPLPQEIASDCLRWKPTVFPAVPVILRALARADIPARKLASLRLVVSAGSPLAPSDARAFLDHFGRPVHGFYGSSETGGICYDRTGTPTLQGAGVGTPLDGVRLTPGRGRRFAVESRAVMGRGRHCPGDFGKLSGTGELTLMGRVGRMIKIGGKRLNPAEVEWALKALPFVRDAVVLPHPLRGERLAAAVLSNESPAVIRGALAGRLAGWKMPDRILCYADFPVTIRGKPDLRRIQAQLGRNGIAPKK